MQHLTWAPCQQPSLHTCMYILEVYIVLEVYLLYIVLEVYNYSIMSEYMCGPSPYFSYGTS